LVVRVPTIGLKDAVMFHFLAFPVRLWLHSVVLSPPPTKGLPFFFTGELEILRPVGVAGLALLDGNVGNK
jgi:hypothetical protein